MDDNLAQEEEINALKSIYQENDIFLIDESKNSGVFYVKLETEQFYTLNFTNEKRAIKVKYLTPIILEFKFPNDYPSKNPPQFKISCRWLSLDNINKLCEKFDEIWAQNENTSILFTWISFLSYEIFDHLNIDINDITINEDIKTSNENNDKRSIKLPFSIRLAQDYDHDQNEFKFQNSYFTCNVCFSDKIGKECFKFDKCEHVFCIECMKGYFETLISDGNVKSLTCPQDKCESQAHPTQVLNLVGQQVFNRYDSLLLKDSLNSMTDVIYCPRKDCQCAVIPEETLAQCTNCKYVFCALCMQGYHGIEPCKISNAQMKEVCFKYTNGSEEERKDLIKRFGEARIKRAIEETSSMDLIVNTSKQCPNCKSWMQKLDGCNKMTCSKCHCYFCWLCSKVLSKADPYSHFNSANSECFEKLFEGMVNENNDQDDDDDDTDNSESEDNDDDFDINDFIIDDDED